MIVHCTETDCPAPDENEFQVIQRLNPYYTADLSSIGWRS